MGSPDIASNDLTLMRCYKAIPNYKQRVVKTSECKRISTHTIAALSLIAASTPSPQVSTQVSFPVIDPPD